MGRRSRRSIPSLGVSWDTSGVGKTYTFSNTTAYRYYRLTASANNGGAYCGLCELVLLGYGQTILSTNNSQLNLGGNANQPIVINGSLTTVTQAMSVVAPLA